MKFSTAVNHRQQFSAAVNKYAAELTNSAQLGCIFVDAVNPVELVTGSKKVDCRRKKVDCDEKRLSASKNRRSQPKNRRSQPFLHQSESTRQDELQNKVDCGQEKGGP